MAVSRAHLARLALVMLGSLTGIVVEAGSLVDIEHVILFMQGLSSDCTPEVCLVDHLVENRAFDHYFGTMAGVRGYSDPNVQMNPDGRSVWQQAVNSNVTNNATYLLPFYLNWEGGNRTESTQCMLAGDNGWQDNHAAINGDLNNHWATNNTPWSWGFYKRSDLPVQFAIADGWTVGDMYQESVLAATCPNRVTWVSGSINAPGSPQSPDQGGNPYIDNNLTPGCDDGGFNCYPLRWKTTAEFYEAANVSWSVFQDPDNFDDNPLAYFAQFQNAPNGTKLSTRGMVGESLSSFYARAANGTLPAISYVIGPMELSEHAPFSPRDGAWLQKKVLDAVTHGSAWSNSVLIYSYDESGGWGDHVTPYHSPPGTSGEWIDDPHHLFGYTYTGPGVRVPFYIVSPWTRTTTGTVFTEHADHNSQILFIEEWLAAKGKSVVTDQMVSWRRQKMSNLLNAFDFQHPDYTLPLIPNAPAPLVDGQGLYYHGSADCIAKYADARPEIPFTHQISPDNVSSLSEQGFKAMRGAMTEGRYIVFERNGWALSNTGHASVEATRAGVKHNDVEQRWIVHGLAVGGHNFALKSAKDGRSLRGDNIGSFCGKDASTAGLYTITFKAGQGYSLRGTDGSYLDIDKNGVVVASTTPAFFLAFSVTYIG